MSFDLDLTEFETEESLEGYDYPKDGQYHAVITGVDESRDRVDAMKIEFTILAGTTEGQTNKKFEETFWDPNPSHKDGGKFARKKLARLALAAGIISPSALGRQVQIDWQELMYRQVKLAATNYERKGDDGKVYKGAQIDGLSVYGPADPAVTHIPVDPEALAMAKDAGQPNVGDGNGNGGAAPPADKAPAAKSPVAAAPGKQDDLYAGL